MSSYIEEAKEVFDIEIEALERTKQALDSVFEEILHMVLECQGKVIVTGMGKSGHIATKLAATFSSLGTPSFYLHPAEALHGDLGMVSDKDLVIAISHSGESDEIIRILPSIKLIGAKIVAISSNAASTLVKNSDLAQIFPPFKEACHLGLAPTSSTTATLVYGDALAVVASRVIGFRAEDFGLYHPAGSLGKRLILRVVDVMVKEDANPIIHEDALLTDAIVEMSRKGLGMVSVLDEEERLVGIITDGDLRRMLERHINVYEALVKDVMTKTPFSVENDILAIEVLRRMKERSINGSPVLDSQKHVIGTVTLQLLIKAGLVL